MKAFLIAAGIILLAPVVVHPANASTGDCGPDNTLAATVPRSFWAYEADGFYYEQRDWPFHDDDWFYQESNGESGLQHGGSSQIVPGDNETCYDDSPSGPDELIY